MKLYIPIEINLLPNNTDKEIFLPVYLDNIKPYYWVSNYGRVINKYTGKEIKGEISNTGYRRVGLVNSEGKHSKISIHRLVAMYFVSGYDEKLCVNHKDGNRLNNFYKNLEWCTVQYNTKHAYANGLAQGVRGKSHYLNKYDESLIRNICELLEKGYLQSEIFKILKFTDKKYLYLINGIKSRSKWKHISQEYNF